MPSKGNKEPAIQVQAPKELMNLASLELKRRRLLRELAEVECQRRHLSREIELKGIPIPWMN